MKKWMKRAGTVMAAALIGVLAFSAVSFAQEGQPPTAPQAQQNGSGFFQGRGGPGGPGGRNVHNREEHKADVAAILGLTVEELDAALANGQTVQQIAEALGIDLQAAMQARKIADIQAKVAAGELTQEEADAIIARIQSGEGPRGPRGLRGGPGAEAMAQALGMTGEELRAALESGQTLEEIAAARGVDLEAVKAQLQAQRLAEAQARLAEAVANGEMTQEQADQILERLQNGERPFARPGRGGRRGPGGFRNGPPSGAPSGAPNGTPNAAPQNQGINAGLNNA